MDQECSLSSVKFGNPKESYPENSKHWYLQQLAEIHTDELGLDSNSIKRGKTDDSIPDFVHLLRKESVLTGGYVILAPLIPFPG